MEPSSISDAPTVVLAAAASPKAPKKGMRLQWHWSRRRVVQVSLIGILLFGVITPTLVFAVSGYTLYQHLKAVAQDGVHHLIAIKNKLPTSSDAISAFFDAQTLNGLQSDVSAAQQDFTYLGNELRSSRIIGIARMLPSFNGKIVTAQHLAQVGQDITQVAQDALAGGRIVVGALSKSPLSSQTPLLTMQDVTQLDQDISGIQGFVHDIEAQVQGVAFNSLLDSSQSALFEKLVSDLPQADGQLAKVQQIMHVLPTVLGLQHPTKLLLVAMDRSELRASGGFQGNYAIMTIAGARLAAPIAMTDTYIPDEGVTGNHQCWNAASLPPALYATWWPYTCWGLRDANLSADFPTTARLDLSLLQAETGQTADGMVAMTPVLIEQVLKLTGPVTIGDSYNVTITSANLEDMIHRFQLTPTGIAAGSDLPPPDQVSSPRKRLLALVARALQDRLGHLPHTALVQIIKDAIDDIASKDVQIYLSDPPAELLLEQQQWGSTIATGSGDGLFVVDTNTSGGKHNRLIQESLDDTVHLDAHGTATHMLTLTYHFNDANNAPIYGPPVYHDYVRIYVPPHSVLLANDASFAATPTDIPGRAMWAGWLYVAPNTTLTVHIHWSVPAMVDAQDTYQLLIQKQAGANNLLTLHIFAAGATSAGVTYVTPKGGILGKDMTFTETHAG
jgi:hypothetical protein